MTAALHAPREAATIYRLPAEGPPVREHATPINVLAALDDAGLTPHAFRVLARICRRWSADRGCDESVPNMATACKMKRQTAWRAIGELVDLGIISTTPRPGQTTRIDVLPQSAWTLGANPETEPAPMPPNGTGTRVPKGDGPPADTMGTHAPKRDGYPCPQTDHKGKPGREPFISDLPPSQPESPHRAGERAGEGLAMDWLEDVKVPLSERERTDHGGRIAEVWRLADRLGTRDPDWLYRQTFGGKRRGTPGGQIHIITALLGRFPWAWLVPAFVVTAGKGAGLESVERFIAQWLQDERVRRAAPGFVDRPAAPLPIADAAAQHAAEDRAARREPLPPGVLTSFDAIDAALDAGGDLLDFFEPVPQGETPAGWEQESLYRRLNGARSHEPA